MNYDFDIIRNRRGTDSLKWDESVCRFPMWVADMDFTTAPAVIKAVSDRALHGVYGYTLAADGFFDAIINRWKLRHGFTIQREWMSFVTGAVPAISSAVKRLTNHGDKVVVQTPAYDIFFHSIENAGRTVSENRLVRNGREYAIDFADLEKKLSDPLATLMIVCNPHNPIGRIHSAEELKAIGELCLKYGVKVISDELHCDLTDPNKSYTPFASASDANKNISVTLLSASKAFNLAGLQGAAAVVPDAHLRNAVFRGLNSDEVAEPNCFACAATAAAFSEGGEWLDALREYLYENKRLATEYIAANLPEIEVINMGATYLLWLDCGKAGDSEKLRRHLFETEGLLLSGGAQYRGDGESFLRMNVACPASELELALAAFVRGVKAFGRG